MRTVAVVFGCTSFLSALLLFQVQLIVEAAAVNDEGLGSRDALFEEDATSYTM